MNAVNGPLPKVDGFCLVIAADGRVKVDNWNGLTREQQRQVAAYVIDNYPRDDNGSDS